MLDRGQRDARPFGTRRAPERPGLAATEAGPAVPAGTGSARPAGPLAWALRTAALAGLAAIFATHYLAHVSGPGEAAATRLAQGGRILPADPETTGSIGRAPVGASRPPAGALAGAARSTRLDPCTVLGHDPSRP